MLFAKLLFLKVTREGLFAANSPGPTIRYKAWEQSNFRIIVFILIKTSKDLQFMIIIMACPPTPMPNDEQHQCLHAAVVEAEGAWLSTNNNLTGPLLIGKDFSGYIWAEKNPTVFNLPRPRQSFGIHQKE